MTDEHEVVRLTREPWQLWSLDDVWMLAAFVPSLDAYRTLRSRTTADELRALRALIDEALAEGGQP